jgi:hypothetical protein
MTSPKPTIKDVVNGTPEGQAAVQKAMEESAKAMSKPTDSEQLRTQINGIVMDVCGEPGGNPSSVATCRELVTGLMMFIAQRDQQRLSAWTTERATYRRMWIPKADVLSAALEALPKQMFSDEDPNNPYHGNYATAYSNGRNTTIIESRQALTAALGPDNK